MRLYTVHKHETLRQAARNCGRSCTCLSHANGIPRGCHLACEDTLIIPSLGACEGRDTMLVCYEAEPVKLGSARKLNADCLSLVLQRIPEIGKHGFYCKNGEIPTILYPAVIDLCDPDSLVCALTACGCAGVCIDISSLTVLHCSLILSLAEALHKKELLLAVYMTSECLLESTQCSYLAHIDLIFTGIPACISPETYLADLTVLFPRNIRRKILLGFSEGDGVGTKRNGALVGRREEHCFHSLKDCHIGVERLLHDGYGGVLIPPRGVSPALLHMLSECASIIPASQRNGGRSRWSVARPPRVSRPIPLQGRHRSKPNNRND